MQSLFYIKPGEPTSVAAKVRLFLVTTITLVLLLIFYSSGAQTESGASVGPAPTTCPEELLKNGGFELPVETPAAVPLYWASTQWWSSAHFSRDVGVAHSGASSVRIIAPTPYSDSWFQGVTVEPQTLYMLTGWIKTENVSSGPGATLSILNMPAQTKGLTGTNNWTKVSLSFNSGSSPNAVIRAQLGASTGTAWFDDLRLTAIRPDGTHPRWKILVLIYDKTDAIVIGTGGVSHHMVGAMTPAEVERAALVATQFVETDIPALTSGNMIPELTIRYPDHALTELDPYTQGSWWPSPAKTAADRDPAFDSVLVIWDPRVVDQYTGTPYWIGGAAGLAPSMGTDQTYAAIIIEATGYGHRNVFKHEWGHSILSYFDAIGTAPKPAVTNHAEINQYVHWPTGDAYVWIDETDANPIPNSIYNNESGFTHDYYSGTTATPDDPTRRLGITPEAWLLGGPVTKPGIPSFPPPIISCNADIVVASEPGACSAKVTLTAPTISDACDSNLTPVATRSDGLPLDAPFSCGRTVITWSVTNSENLTSTCQQAVTVTDSVPPAFIHTPPPVTVTTGPTATSCGAVIDDTHLGSTAPAADPLIPDPIGDVGPSWASYRNDITSTAATFNGGSLTFKVNFVEHVYAASSGDPRYLTGFIDIDSDQDPATGGAPAVDVMGPPAMNLGVDFQIELVSELDHPGFVNVRSKQGVDAVIGTVPILFTDTSFSVTVPLTMLGGDNGLVNYGVGVGVQSTGQTDRVPNGALPVTSTAVPELIAMDGCAGITISRNGMPPNNFFPVGETIITYTATDASGNTASVSQSVTVVDDTPPLISGLTASPSTLWPPNHAMVDVTLSYEVADNCGILDTSLSISSEDPSGGSGGSDWEIVDAHHVRLRAQRWGRWGERLYTVTITATDVHGNVSNKSLDIRVPQGKRGSTGT